MDGFLQFAREGFEALQPFPYLQALLIIITFGILAKLVDRVISGIISRLVARTQTNVDDQLVAILHRPIFTSVAMIGLVLATYRLDFGPVLRTTTIAVIQTLLIVTNHRRPILYRTSRLQSDIQPIPMLPPFSFHSLQFPCGSRSVPLVHQ